MAHPYSKFNEKDAGKARAKHLTKGYARGGKAHSDEAQDKKLISKMISAHDRKVEGKASGGRLDKFARGGRTRGTNIKIAIVAPGAEAGARPPMMSFNPVSPGGGPPPMPMPPPGAGPGGPPPMMKRGGKVGMKAGAETGEGRLQKAKAYGIKAKK